MQALQWVVIICYFRYSSQQPSKSGSKVMLQGGGETEAWYNQVPPHLETHSALTTAAWDSWLSSPESVPVLTP